MKKKQIIENVKLLCLEYPCLGWPGPGAIVVMMTVVIKSSNYDEKPWQMDICNGNFYNNDNDKIKSTMPHTMSIAMQIIMMTTHVCTLQY